MEILTLGLPGHDIKEERLLSNTSLDGTLRNNAVQQSLNVTLCDVRHYRLQRIIIQEIIYA